MLCPIRPRTEGKGPVCRAPRERLEYRGRGDGGEVTERDGGDGGDRREAKHLAVLQIAARGGSASRPA